MDKLGKINFAEYVISLLSRIKNGEELSVIEKNFLISWDLLNEILDKAFDQIQEKEEIDYLNQIQDIDKKNAHNNYSNLISEESFLDENKKKLGVDRNIGNITKQGKNNNIEENSLYQGNEGNKDNDGEQHDGWFFNYDDSYINNLRKKIKNSSPVKKTKIIKKEKKKPTKTQSKRTVPAIPFDYLLPKDLNPFGLLNIYNEDEIENTLNNSKLNIDDNNDQIIKKETNDNNKNTKINFTNKNKSNNVNQVNKTPDKNKKRKDIHTQLMSYSNSGIKALKKFFKSNTIQPINYPEIDGKLVLKNWKFLTEKKRALKEFKYAQMLQKSLYTEESLINISNDSLDLKHFKHFKTENFYEKINLSIIDHGEVPEVKDIKTKDLAKRVYLLKNLNTLRKTFRNIRENWILTYDNPNIDEKIKLKLFDIQSNKDGLKNKLEDKVKENINIILNADLNSDKNNKLSKKLINLYREEIYDLDIENFEEKSNKIIPKPTFIGAKAKILQENKDYLISVYFDIYDDILNDIFNSGKSIFDFNEDLKGSSILKNFQMRPRERQETIYNSPLKDKMINKIENLRSGLSLKLSNTSNNNYSKENSICSDHIFNKGFKNLCTCLNINNDNDETRSNYDRLGLANQTYINNILLRDFSYKEKLQYIETSKSDSLSENSLENTSRMNDSINSASSPKNRSNKSQIKIMSRPNEGNNKKNTLLKIFREPFKKMILTKNNDNPILAYQNTMPERGSLTGNTEDISNLKNKEQDSLVNEHEEFYDVVHEMKNIKQKNSVDEYSENDNMLNKHGISPLKRKTKKDKKRRMSKFISNSRDKSENLNFLEIRNFMFFLLFIIMTY